MAWKAPGLTKAVAVANGTNNFVLSDPASQGPYRTDVQANADGSLPTGSTVHYVAWRTTTTGDAEFEEGWGTYTLATRVVTRTAGNVIDGSAGPGILVDFGLSGQMDMFFLAVLDGSDVPSSQHATFAANLGLPRLDAANVFTQAQSVTKDLLVDRADTARAGIRARTDKATAGLIAEYTGEAQNGSAGEVVFGRVRIYSDDVTAGSEDGSCRFEVVSGGVSTERLKLAEDGALTAQPSGSKYVAFPAGGTVGIHFDTAPPAGFTRRNETQSRLIRLAKSGDTIGATGGSDDVFDGAWSTLGHSLTGAETGAHSHTIPVVGGSGGAGVGIHHVSDGSTVPPKPSTDATSSSSAHSHNMTTPYYKITCFASFD